MKKIYCQDLMKNEVWFRLNKVMKVLLQAGTVISS